MMPIDFVEQTTRTLIPQTREHGAETLHYSLVVITDGQMTTFPLPDEGRVILGRSKIVDIVIDHASISRRHAELSVGNPFRLRDLGSRNGTRVGEKVLEPGVW